MSGLSMVHLLGSNVPGEVKDVARLPEGKSFSDLLKGRFSRTELEDIVSRLESLGEEVDPALLEILRQTAMDGNDLPIAAISLPPDMIAEPSGGEAGSELEVVTAQPSRLSQTENPLLASTVAASGKETTPLPAATAQMVVSSISRDPGADFQADLDGAAIDLRSTGLQTITPRALQEGAVTTASRMIQITPRVGEAGWHQAVADRVMMMVGRDLQSVELRLNPAHLGPMEVKLSLNHDQASVSFLANHAAVRDALEQAIPRLRDMLGQQDIQLVQADVGQRQPSAEQGGRQGADSSGTAHGEAAVDETLAEDGQTVNTALVKRGLVDAYV